ncbi:hypothetical protein F2Q65_17965 [Thiohalocapsa marina]|uniref:Uncharacterized protein n=1 Tax=Thiohalocapsa marina TaxID=424902 RepID=A0A5M8FCM2_9GAMM|nr:hypothetical protein [Thiohalocapsa marina]KAA6182409.1 hypothetical protein F2Q65_17965 [Thiohalocapsa marina]
MKYAARRIWPEKSQAWEYLGEAEGIEDFALMFASDKALAVDTEFVVIEKAGADSDIEFYKVSRAAPYAIVPADPRAESSGPAAPAAPAQGDAGSAADTAPNTSQYGHSIGEVWRAMFGNALFFGKVSFTALLFFIGLIFLARWLFGAW